MALTLSALELMAYTDGERAKWERWFGTQPAAVLSTVVQRVGTLHTVWQTMDHIFLVEKRHTERLTGAPSLSVETGVGEPDVAGLFGFGRAARREFRCYIAALDEEEAERPRVFALRDASYELTPRKLIFHVFLHEVRHWAQVAAAVRNAGFPPPAEHDLLYSAGLR